MDDESSFDKSSVDNVPRLLAREDHSSSEYDAPIKRECDTDNDAFSMPHVVSCVLDYSTASSSETIFPFTVFRNDEDSHDWDAELHHEANKEDKNFIDESIPFPDSISVGTPVSEP